MSARNYGAKLGPWRRYSSERAPCPGCVANNEHKPAHGFCRHQPHEHGERVACRKLKSTPAGWKRLGTDSQGCEVYFVPHDSATPTPLPRVEREKPAGPKLAGEKLVEFVENLARALDLLERREHRPAVGEFYRSRGVPFDPRLYAAGPSQKEALDVVQGLRVRGQLPQGVSVPGFHRETLSVHARGEAWEWVLGEDGRRVSWSRRLLRPDKGENKTRNPASSTQRLHHSIGWRENLSARGALVVTEGTRKANEIARRTGLAAVGAPGVDLARSVRGELEHALRETRPQLVLLAPDFADLRNGERDDNVRRAVSGWAWIAELVSSWGGEARGLTWERGEKGLDDVLADLEHEGEGLPAEVCARPWAEYLEAFRWRDVSRSAPAYESKRELREVPEFVPQRPTRGLVRTSDDAQRVSGEIAASWIPGTSSLHFAGWPGLGKTRAFGRVELERLATRSGGWECGVGAHALPTREIVGEKARALRDEARTLGLEVEVLELLGRSAQSFPWRCDASERAKLRANLRHPSCAGCELKAACESTAGHYRHTRAGVVRAVKEAARGGRPVLVVGTFEALRYLRELPDEAPFVLDDVRAFSSLFTSHELKLADLRSALERLEGWIDWIGATPSMPIREGGEVAEVHVAPFVLGVLRAIGSTGARRNVETFVRGYEPAFLEALRQDRVHPSHDGWSWEDWRPDDGPDGRPAFASFALDITRELFAGGTFGLHRKPESDALELVLSERRMLERVRAGRVAWLSVAPIPQALASSLNVRPELVHANPEHLELVVGEHRILGLEGRERVESFGPTIDGDEIVRQLVRRLEASGHNVGAVVSKADHEELDDLEHVAHYGAGHASTDKLAGCAPLLVRRGLRPYGVLTFEGALWRGLLGLPAAPLVSEVALEPRRWTASSAACPSVVPADSLERELLEEDEAHFMLNAIGRARPLTATSRRLVLVLNGRPFNLHGAHVRVAPLADVARELGVELELPDEDSRRRRFAASNAAKAEEAAELLQRARELVEGNPFASRRWLCAELGVSDRRARRLLEQLQAGHLGQLAPLLGNVRGLLEGRGKFGPTSHRETENASKAGGADLSALPNVESIVEELGEFAPTARSVRTHRAAILEALRTGSPLIPRRSDAAAALAGILRAVAHLLEREAFELVPQPAPAQVRLLRHSLPLAVGQDAFPLPLSRSSRAIPCETTPPSSSPSVPLSGR